ncbi:MAG: winged helix-turn-helix domain-containing protein [Candidatus Thermoplasmatota archaeon]|nr:winged helix-turn-helix domain-containing protein [Candidatus Thermoplasmatota archaeon]MCL5680430.1 winged helix-turn-helix domain-containing protein [Candidatus Thermoplasmatota archaeon]
MKSTRENFKPDLYVISRIIKTLVEDGPQKKTALSTKTGLSYDNLARYAEWMASKELIRDDNGTLAATEKGSKTYSDLVAWVITYVGKLRFGKS